MRATNLCTQIGSVIPNITLAFPPRSVSDFNGVVDLAFNPDSMADCTATTVPPRGIGSPAFNPHGGCFPLLNFQAAMLAPFQSVWSGCDNISGLVLDPPIHLTPAAALVSATTSCADSSRTHLSTAAIGEGSQSMPRSTALTKNPWLSILDRLDPSIDPTASTIISNDRWPSTAAQVYSKTTNPPLTTVNDPATASLAKGPGEVSKPNSAIVLGYTTTVSSSKVNSHFTGRATSLAGDPMTVMSGMVEASDPEGMTSITVSTHDTFLSKPTISKPTSVVAAGQTVDIPETGAADITVGSHVLGQQNPAITISGTVFSLGSNALIVGTSTMLFSSGAQPASKPTNNVPVLLEFTVGTRTFTVKSNGVVMSQTTITMGDSPVTVDGTPISLGSSGIVIGGRTQPFEASKEVSSARDLGAFIISGLGGAGKGPVSTGPANASLNGSSYAPFLGAAIRYQCTMLVSAVLYVVWMSWYIYIFFLCV